jgi:hypothetical protein
MIVCPKMQTQMQMEIKRTTAMIAMMISSMGMPATVKVYVITLYQREEFHSQLVVYLLCLILNQDPELSVCVIPTPEVERHRINLNFLLVTV